MRRTSPVILALALVAGACSDTTGVGKGPLRLGVVDGNHQVAIAGDVQLGKGVKTRMVRDRSGRVSLHLVRPLYAQGTVVQGSPVPGAVVCAEPPDTIPEDGSWLRPFQRCNSTDAAGEVIFHFRPGTRAGEIPAEIRGTVEGEPTVFDRVIAYVEPGALHGWSFNLLAEWPTEGDTIDYAPLVQGGFDRHGNSITAEAVLAMGEPTWQLVIPAINSSNPAVARPESVHASGTGWVVVTPPWRPHDGAMHNAYWLRFTIVGLENAYTLSVHPTSAP